MLFRSSSVSAMPDDGKVDETLVTVRTVVIEPVRSICTIVRLPNAELNFWNCNEPAQSVNVGAIGVVVVKGPDTIVANDILGRTHNRTRHKTNFFYITFSFPSVH